MLRADSGGFQSLQRGSSSAMTEGGEGEDEIQFLRTVSTFTRRRYAVIGGDWRGLLPEPLHDASCLLLWLTWLEVWRVGSA